MDEGAARGERERDREQDGDRDRGGVEGLTLCWRVALLREDLDRTVTKPSLSTRGCEEAPWEGSVAAGEESENNEADGSKVSEEAWDSGSIAEEADVSIGVSSTADGPEEVGDVDSSEEGEHDSGRLPGAGSLEGSGSSGSFTDTGT